MNNNNQNNINVSAEKQQELINTASKFLGKDPAYINQQLQSGNIQNLLSGLSQQQSDQIKSVLNNQQLISQIMSNPQVLKMLGKK